MNKPLALIVEDDKDSARLYSRIMEPLGYDFDFAGNKAAAMSRLDELVPNLVLLDISLVHRKLDHSGIEILNRIRNDERFAATRVVVISAYSKLIDELQAEVDGVIIKPVNAKKLLDLVAGLN